MNFTEKVLELDFAYMDTFTRRVKTSWGYLLINEDQPNYYDANHAHIKQKPSNSNDVINEVIHFYKERNLTPRFYIYDFDDNTEFIKALTESGFQVESFHNAVQLWNNQLQERSVNSKVTIEVVSTANYAEALNIECSISEFGGKEVREKAFEQEFLHPSYTHFLLSYNGVPCSTACIFAKDKQARLETVATLKEYRGKGLIGELIHHMQKEVQQLGLNEFWVFPINERVEQVYTKYGFNTIGKLKIGHAFLGGKSITEIQNRSNNS